MCPSCSKIRFVSAEIVAPSWRKFSLILSGIQTVVSTVLHRKLGHCHINTGIAEML